MKIGWNGWFLCQPYTGIGRYTLNLIKALGRIEPTYQWLVVIPCKIPPKQLNFPSSVQIKVLPEKKIPIASLRKFYWEQVQVPNFFKKEHVDIAHYPYPSNPFFPGRRNTKTVVTVHDTIPWELPEYRRCLRTRLYQSYTRKALKKADLLIAVSQSTALALLAHFSYPHKAVTVIHEAPDPIFTKRIAKKRLSKPYFIYVGGYDPRKNVKRLVEAFNAYIAPYFKTDLLLVGAKNLNQSRYRSFPETKALQSLLKATANSSHLPGRLILLPSLPPRELAAYYHGALALVNFSLAEGFNIPLLEGAACGIPLITSDLPIHREIIGHKVLCCDPQHIKTIGETLLNFLRNDTMQLWLKSASKQIAANYSWEKTAFETLAIYNSI